MNIRCETTTPLAHIAATMIGLVAVRYVLPVLWMPSCFDIIDPVWQRVTTAESLQFRSRVNAPAAWNWRAPRLDDSFVQVLPGAESGMHHCLVGSE